MMKKLLITTLVAVCAESWSNSLEPNSYLTYYKDQWSLIMNRQSVNDLSVKASLIDQEFAFSSSYYLCRKGLCDIFKDPIETQLLLAEAHTSGQCMNAKPNLKAILPSNSFSFRRKKEENIEKIEP